MAAFLKRWSEFRKSPLGQLFLAIVYLLMLCCVLAFFTGNGAFIYEGF